MSPRKREPADHAKAQITEFEESGDDPITAELRKLYDDAVAEPLPDHLLRLLDRLAEAESKR